MKRTRSRRDRRPRLDPSVYGYSGHAVHLTIGTYGAQPHFARSAELARMVIGALEAAATACKIRLLCYCLMPDHLHVVAVVEPGGADIAKFVKSFKTRATLAARRSGLAHLWQRSFYDRVIRRNQDLQEVCLYVVNNPVRRGLASNWQSYPLAWLSEEV